jgi:hypothetical protein
MAGLDEENLPMDSVLNGLKTRDDIAVAWNGLPAYGARLIRAAQDRVGTFPVLGTRPSVPIDGMEAILGQSVHWLEEDSQPTWEELGLPVPQTYFQTGWGHPSLNALGEQVWRQGGQVVSMIDNPWKGTLRQYVGGLVFRLRWRRRFSAVLVPGKRARQLSRYLGMPHDRIYEGMYGGDPAVFHSERPLQERSKRFLFVGQFIERKGVLELAEAFASMGANREGWQLTLVGSGPLKEQLRGYENIEVLPFAQPEAIAALMMDSRCLVLPSREEHWGLVVHEAALAGCLLALTKVVGAAPDLLNEGVNGVAISECQVDAIRKGLCEVASWNDERVASGQTESLKMATAFGPEPWARTFCELLDRLREE